MRISYLTILFAVLPEHLTRTCFVNATILYKLLGVLGGSVGAGLVLELHWILGKGGRFSRTHVRPLSVLSYLNSPPSLAAAVFRAVSVCMRFICRDPVLLPFDHAPGCPRFAHFMWKPDVGVLCEGYLETLAYGALVSVAPLVRRRNVALEKRKLCQTYSWFRASAAGFRFLQRTDMRHISPEALHPMAYGHMGEYDISNGTTSVVR